MYIYYCITLITSLIVSLYFFSVDRAKKQYEKEEMPNNDRRDAVQSLIRSSQNGPGWRKGGRTESGKKGKLEENLVPVYVASEGYVTRRTWCSHGRFSSLRVLSRDSLDIPSVHRDIHLSTSLVRRCVTAEMIRTCRNGETDAMPLFDGQPAIPTNRSRTDLFPRDSPHEFRGKNARVPDFPGGTYRNVFDILYFQWLREKFFENCRLRVWEREKGVASFTRVEY